MTKRQLHAVGMHGIRALAAMVLLAGVPVSPAAAQLRTPSVGCQIADTNIALDLHLPLSRDGSGNAARGMRGSLEIHHQKLPRERRSWPLDDKLPAQFWNWGGELKIRLLLAGGEQLLDLVIETRQLHGGPHTGTFRLEAAEGVKISGRIECTVG
jgi:hypothetical protein